MGGCSGTRVSMTLSPMALIPDAAGLALALVTSPWDRPYASTASARGPNMSGGHSVKASHSHAVVVHKALLGKNGLSKPQLFQSSGRGRPPAPPPAQSIALPYHPHWPLWIVGFGIFQAGAGVAKWVLQHRATSSNIGPMLLLSHRRMAVIFSSCG